MKHICMIGAAITAVAAVAMASSPAYATPTWTASGTCQGEACGSSAQITLESFTAPTGGGANGSAVFEISITDTQSNPHSSGDLVSGIILSLSESYGSVGFDTSPPAPSAQNETLVTVDSKTGPYTEATNVQTHWGIGGVASGSNCASSSTKITLETAGGCAQPSQPINMIIGQPNGSGNYSNANSSITDGHFSPYILGTGIFWIDVTGLSGLLPPTISGVQFAFGTGPDSFLTGKLPEPFTLSLFGGGLAGIVATRRRRKKA